MPLKFSLTYNINQTKEQATLSGELTDEECEFLTDFVNYANEVFETKFIQDRNFGAYSISQKENNPVQFSNNLPNWDNFMVFVHKLRPLILKNERTYFHKVRSLLGKKLPDTFIRNFLSFQKDIFKGISQQNFELKSDGVLVNTEEVLYDWLNAYEYHRDKDKQKFIESLHKILPLNVSKVIFITLLLDKAKAIFNLADFTDLLLGKHKTLNIQGRLKD